MALNTKQSKHKAHRLEIEQAEKLLRDKGFKNFYIWTEEPKKIFNKHAHAKKTGFAIMNGSLTSIDEKKQQNYLAGDYFCVKVGEKHRVVIGENGAIYMAGT